MVNASMRLAAVSLLAVLGAARSAYALPEPPRPQMVPQVPETVPANLPVLITVQQADGPVIGVARVLRLQVDGRTRFDEQVDPFVDRPDPPVYLL